MPLPKGTIVIVTGGLPQDREAAGHLKALGGSMPSHLLACPGPLRALGSERPRGTGERGGLHAGRRRWTERALGTYPDLEEPRIAMSSARPRRTRDQKQQHGTRARGCGGVHRGDEIRHPADIG